MNICRKICVVFSKLVTKIIGEINFCKRVKKIIVKVQVSTIGLNRNRNRNRKRSNTYNQSIENEMITQNILIKSKMRFS